ncbi:hypothetical protein K2173_002359 [Erythroxylum novogranatense]|uniref:ADP-ribosylation factor-like protein 8A n=1 Tax=Erythroxylum novogranatense TaxID=1862640 RepID=A0AAV8T9R0_9ROSI|nr:hypothetical protein K2173_002359 [Erythroxylum novogranatense]
MVNFFQTGGYSEDMIPTVSHHNNFSFYFVVRAFRKFYALITFKILLLFSFCLQVGFNMRKVTKGNVTIKLWDLGGQPRFRSMWERYCRAVSAIVYVVDAADYDNLPVSKNELHDLLSKPSLNGIPLLVLGNKIDKPGALSKHEFTEQMGLKSITDREVCCFMISCKNSTNIDTVIDWLVKHSKSKN